MRKGMRALAVAVLICGLAVCLTPGISRADDGEVRLYCLNIGKADCLLLMTGERAYLIDAGYAHTYPAVETALDQLGIRRLNGVFLTHCHKDHAGGFPALAASDVQVDAWYAAALNSDGKPEQHPAGLAAAARGSKVSWLNAGEVIPVDDVSAFTVLGPLSLDPENENNNSLVLRFSSPQGSILLAGDMKEEEEADLLAAGKLQKSDVLKVGHHGDSEATTLSFLRVVQPRVAVISTSTLEETDTPAPETLRRLAAAGCETHVTQNADDAVLVTLRQGAVSVQNVVWTGIPARAEGVSLMLEGAQDTLTLRNDGQETLSLAGCLLYSTRGEETLVLPGETLEPGESLCVGSRFTETAYDVFWPEKRVWHKKKRDVAILYDVYGRVLACTDNGLPE